MTKIEFAEEKNGYDKDQVDNYIHKLTSAYQKTYEEYLATCEKYNSLNEAYKRLEEENQIGVNTDVVTKVLADSEKLAQELVETAYKIIANAYNEEARIVEKAKRNFEQVNEKIEQAMSEAQNFFTFRNTKDPGGTLNEYSVAAGT